ncbi:MAG: GHMP family kinase ATP-binding protein [Candidatus Heimdallarchaeaceae archaeon]|jgi:galactokinase
MYFSSAPARVCLYGEHQDYLGLKVIPAAINFRFNISSLRNNSKQIKVKSLDLNQETSIFTGIDKFAKTDLSFTVFLESGILAIKRKFPDIEIPGLTAKIQSDIPIASGLSSSAAFLVSWIKHLDGILKLNQTGEEIAELAYDAEHNLMQIPCGRMDQYSSSLGSLISMMCTDPPTVRNIRKPDFELLVVDSQTPKFTIDVHGKKVQEIHKAIKQYKNETNYTLNDTTLEILQKVKEKISSHNYKIMKGVISIKEDTKIAEGELLKNNPDLEILGELLTSQQNSLREYLGVSLPILDNIVNQGIKRGALGGKLTGAGLGGSVVLLTKNDDYKLKKFIQEKFDLPVWLVKVDRGVFFEEK